MKFRLLVRLGIALSVVVLTGIAAVWWRGRAARDPAKIGREVLAFYNGWYDIPERWRNARGPLIAARPAYGRYNSRDTAVIRQQVTDARRAGLTAFAASWAGRADSQDSTLMLLLREAERQQFRVAVFLEWAGDSTALQARLDEILTRFATSPAYARTPDGRPIILLYIKAVMDAPIAWWRRTVAARRDVLLAAMVDGQVGDDYSTFPISWYYSYLFDPWEFRTMPQVRSNLRWFLTKNVVRRALVGRAFACTVEPGFDNRLLVRNFPVKVAIPFTPRSAAYYAARWDAVADVGCAWILVTSWNEWYETTGIEPDSAMGDTLVRVTATRSSKFLARDQGVPERTNPDRNVVGPLRTPPAPQSPVRAPSIHP